MTTVLLTGFEPFGGDAVNPSGDAVRVVAAEWSGPQRLVTEVLPVGFAAATAKIARLIAEHRPEVVVATGLAGGRDAVTPERVAINLADARIPDNAGAQPCDEPLAPDGPAAYFATLPVKAMAAAVSREGIPASVSHTAGTFVCDAVMYAALHATAGGAARAAFVHVPWSEEAAPTGAPAMPLADIARALTAAVRAACTHEADVVAVGGALH